MLAEPHYIDDIGVFRARGAIRPDETTVVRLTGSALKAATTMGELFAPGGEAAR